MGCPNRQGHTVPAGTGRANGMAFDKDGDLIAGADMHGELWKIRPDGSHKVLVEQLPRQVVERAE